MTEDVEGDCHKNLRVFWERRAIELESRSIFNVIRDMVHYGFLKCTEDLQTPFKVSFQLAFSLWFCCQGEHSSSWSIHCLINGCWRSKCYLRIFKLCGLFSFIGFIFANLNVYHGKMSTMWSLGGTLHI